MINIIVVFPKQEDAKSIRGLLVRNGYNVTGVCTTGAQAISQAEELNDGIVICGYKLVDMLFSRLHDLLPPGFELLLLASRQYLSECEDSDVVRLPMPLKVHELLETVGMMAGHIERRRRRQKAVPKVRSEQEKALIARAKELLMRRNDMAEEEAYRYIQKCSMDSCTGMTETAQMILMMMDE